MKIDHLDIADWVNINPHRFQTIARIATRRIGRWLFRYRGYGRERIPAQGGFIIAPNHGSYLDGFFFGHGTDRHVRFMAKYQALEWPVVGRIIRWGGGFPVRRGSDGQPALTIAEQVLASGHGLIMFMEGRLVRTPDLGEPYRGLAVLALRSGVPVVPVAAWGNKPAYVYGRRRWPSWPRTTVVWGEPMSFPSEEEPSDERVCEVRDAIWAAVTELHEHARELHHHPNGRPVSWELPTRDPSEQTS
jgi:1-acyl-sn-glycerol-3-phosphate acyltransferase